MSPDTMFVFGLVLGAAGLMATNRVRFDLIALGVVLILMVSGILDVGEALSGFSNSVVIVVAGLLVVGEMLDRTGVVRAVGDWILRKGGNDELRLLVVIMVSAAALSAVMSSTAVVAIFIPIVLRISAQTGLNGSRLLLPMSYAALISGMLTLIATPPNLVISEELSDQGYTPLGFFSFAPIGLTVLLGAVVFMALIGRRLLPDNMAEATDVLARRSVQDLWDEYRVDRTTVNARLTSDSDLAGQSIGTAELETRFGVRVLGLRRTEAREERIVIAPPAETDLRVDDSMVLAGRPQEIDRLIDEHSLESIDQSDRQRQRWLWDLGVATVLVHPHSRLLGHSVKDAKLRSRYGVEVVGVKQGDQAVEKFEEVDLHAFDSLLVVGPWNRLEQLEQRNHDFVLLETPAEQDEVVREYRRMPIAIGILLGMVTLTLFDVVPLAAAVLMAAVGGVVTGCLRAEEAYRSIHWSSVVLIAGMMPLALALQKSGGTTLIVERLLEFGETASPSLLFSVIFFLTASLSLVLSNTATAVLVAPIAVAAAEALGLSPYPFAIAALLGASSAFISPVASPVVTLVVEPGRYSLADFLKLGLPLMLMTWAVALTLTPVLFPYH